MTDLLSKLTALSIASSMPASHAVTECGLAKAKRIDRASKVGLRVVEARPSMTAGG